MTTTTNKLEYFPIRVPTKYQGRMFKDYCIRFLEQYKNKIWEGGYIVDIVPTFEYKPIR